MEQQENYAKQTYRNRCTLLSANGPLDLTIPIVKKSGNKMPIKDVTIEYSTPWQKIHWKAIESAYKSSPYFEHLEDILKPNYEKQTKYLFDFNLNLLGLLLGFLEIKVNIETTKEYIHSYPANFTDLRGISPKGDSHQLLDPNKKVIPYYQVFSHKMPFVPNLSILDLICNEGLLSIEILKQPQIKMA